MKTYKGKPVTLIEGTLNIGDQAPNFRMVNNQLEDVTLADFKNDYIVISVVPSIDTPVCDLQTKTINSEVLKYHDLDIETITASMDLPFAQQRWINDEELEGSIILSDYNYRDFGRKYGVLIEELMILARAVFILNKKREVIFKLDVEDMSQHLDYDLLVNFIKELPGK